MRDLELRALLQNKPGPMQVAVRPTRWQLARARLILLARSRKGLGPAGLLSFCIGACLSIGSLHLLGDVLRYGLLPVLQVSWLPIIEVFAIFAAGAGALAAAALHAGDELSRRELETGALLHFNPEGVAATVTGATHYFDWEHVRLHLSSIGLLIELPRGAFHLLPSGALALPPRSTVISTSADTRS